MIRLILFVFVLSLVGCANAQDTVDVPKDIKVEPTLVPQDPIVIQPTTKDEANVLPNLVPKLRERLKSKIPQKSLVLMLTRKGCAPCKIWWEKYAGTWRKSGWQVEQANYEGNLPTPWFVVQEGDKLYRVVGPLDTEAYERAKARGPVAFEALENDKN